MKYITNVDGQNFEIEINEEHKVSINGQVLAIDFADISQQQVFTLLVDGKSYEAYIYEGDENDWRVQLRGQLYSAQVEDERERRLREAGGGSAGHGSGEFQLKAPMPGLIVTVPVVEGGHVEKGQALVILESMKMQNELRAPRAGTVSRITVGAGQSVDQGQVLVVLGPEGAG
jgi:biotin carboxyl carrier protein